MKQRWASWVAFAGAREGGLTLALFRIAVGLIAFGGMLETVLYGVAPIVWVDKESGGAFELKGNWLIRLVGGPSSTVVWTFIVLSLIGSLCVAFGLGGRAITFLTLQVYGATTTLNSEAGGGYDALITNAMWLLFLGGASSNLSLDCRLSALSKKGRGRFWDPTIQVPAFARRLAIFQILVVYTATGLQKLSPVWTPVGGYSALYWVYQETTWPRFDMRWTANVYPVTQVMTAVTWHWEMSAFLMFFFYWFRATRERTTPGWRGWLRTRANRYDLRKPFLAIGALLHLGVLATIAVGPFSYISLAYYLAFFTPDEANGLLERVSLWLSSRATRLFFARG